MLVYLPNMTPGSRLCTHEFAQCFAMYADQSRKVVVCELSQPHGHCCCKLEKHTTYTTKVVHRTPSFKANPGHVHRTPSFKLCTVRPALRPILAMCTVRPALSCAPYAQLYVVHRTPSFKLCTVRPALSCAPYAQH